MLASRRASRNTFGRLWRKTWVAWNCICVTLVCKNHSYPNFTGLPQLFFFTNNNKLWPPLIPKVRAPAEAVEVLTTPKIEDANILPPEEPQDEHQLIVVLVAAA